MGHRGRGLTVATKARAVAPHHEAFISDLRWMNLGRSFEPVSPAPTIRRPEMGATRPTRSADGRSAYPDDTAPVLGMELFLPGSGGGVASGGAMSALQEVGGNARWLSSQCPRCIADWSARRTADPRAAPGRSASRRLGDLVETSLSRARAARRFCFASPRRAISPYLGASEQEPAVGRLRSRDGHPGVTSW